MGLEIIATTDRSTNFETHVFRLYSHLCGYMDTDLDSISRLAAGSA